MSKRSTETGPAGVASMTGFARAEGALGVASWAWEARSVNAKGLDVRVRLPAGHDRLEPAVREAAGKAFKRGALNLSLTLERAEAGPRYRIDRDFLDELIALHDELRRKVDPAPPRLDALLQVRGVVEPEERAGDEEDRDALDAALVDTLDEALAALAATRAEEGARLEAILAAQLDEMTELADAAAATAAAAPEALRERIAEQVAALMSADRNLPEERIAQEAALLAARADVREELDRLAAHFASAREMLAAGGPVGRRLDFLCQELNREANTLCSKAQDVELTRLGLALKAAIEQFREQVQNVE